MSWFERDKARREQAEEPPVQKSIVYSKGWRGHFIHFNPILEALLAGGVFWHLFGHHFWWSLLVAAAAFSYSKVWNEREKK